MKLRITATEPLYRRVCQHSARKRAGSAGPDVVAQPGASPRWYLLQGREVVPCTLEEMVRANGGFQTILQSVYRGIMIRTVFTAVDYGTDKDTPALFETVVVGGSLDGFTTRRTTLLDAELTHREVFDEVVRLDSILRWTVRAMRLRLQHLRRVACGSANDEP